MKTRNRKNRQIVEFGDFQTPLDLADEICHFLFSEGVRPESVVEPTCGTGGFIASAMAAFEHARKFLGIEVNREYLRVLEQKLRGADRRRIELRQADFLHSIGRRFWPVCPNPYSCSAIRRG